jgi:hypothetical protein
MKTPRTSLKTIVALGMSVFLFALAMVAHPTAAKEVVDQSFTSSTTAGATINECCQFIAQTFTAGATGNLAGININVLSNSAYPLHVAIRSVRNGVPSSTVLGETTLNASSAPLSLLITFPPSIKVVAGTQYAIVVNYEGAPPAGPGQSQGSWLGATNNYYTRGDGYGFDGITWFDLGVDLHFQTYMKGGRR